MKTYLSKTEIQVVVLLCLFVSSFATNAHSSRQSSVGKKCLRYFAALDILQVMTSEQDRMFSVLAQEFLKDSNNSSRTSDESLSVKEQIDSGLKHLIEIFTKAGVPLSSQGVASVFADYVNQARSGLQDDLLNSHRLSMENSAKRAEQIRRTEILHNANSNLQEQINLYPNRFDINHREFARYYKLGSDVKLTQEKKNKLFFEYAQVQDSASLLFFLNLGADINARFFVDGVLRNATALQVAIKYRYYERADLLVSLGANVNVKDDNGNTLLLTAINREEPMTLEFLLRMGADPEILNENQETALLRAIQKDYTVGVKLLVQGGAKLNTLGQSQETVLMAAISRLFTDGIRLLLNAGADLEVFDGYQKTALMRAIRRHYTEGLTLLIEAGANVNAVNENQETALMIAIKEKYTAGVSLLLKAGADANSSNSDYSPLLRLAVSDNYIKGVELLLQAGAAIPASLPLNSANAEIKALIEKYRK